MFKWLTRRDGRRGAKAARRLSSSRASVFSEFALVMPLVVLVCSALIEIVGFWDAQVMANHAAWTVGRIAMVRGSDGLEFSKNLSKKSKTGIKGSEMPQALKNAFAGLDTVFQGANKFNNRGNVATMMLMSTCGIGYYGASPGKTLSDGFSSLCEMGTAALTNAIPQCISDWATNAVCNLVTSGIGQETGITGFVQNLVKQVVGKVVDVAVAPIAQAITKLLTKAFNKIVGEEGSKIDKLFSGKSAAARHARQIFGAASRIARAKKAVVTVTDMDAKGSQNVFVFAESAAHGRLVYPQVVDAGASSDGYFVKGEHGWPANQNAHALVHVEINWPYEYAWLFPVVSGRGGTSSSPLATGHSMVFPQPDIANDNLYSDAASGFAPGAYTNAPATKGFEDLADEVRDYLKRAQFCMKFRISEETLTLGDEAWYAYSWKRCNELKELFGIGKGKGGGDYADCWSALTDGKDQDSTMKTLKPYFEEGSYRNREYFYWDGSYHRKYLMTNGDMANGDAGLHSFYEGGHTWRCLVGGRWVQFNSKPLTYVSDSEDIYADTSFDKLYKNNAAKIEEQIYQKLKDERVNLPSLQMLRRDEKALRTFGLYTPYYHAVDEVKSAFKQKIVAFAARNKVNITHLVKWQGYDVDAWKKQDAEIHTKASKTEKKFAAIKNLVHKEINELSNMINGKSTSVGSPNDPVLTAADEEAMKDPAAAAKNAQNKWAELKGKLHDKLVEIDQAAKSLRDEWSNYSSATYAFKTARQACVSQYFTEACFKLYFENMSTSFLDEGREADFRIPPAYMQYNIVQGTSTMLARLRAYDDKLEASYKLEVEYGALLGLESAGAAQREGKSLDEVVDAADGVKERTPGSLEAGDDHDEVINKDHQTYEGGRWQWK